MELAHWQDLEFVVLIILVKENQVSSRGMRLHQLLDTSWACDALDKQNIRLI
jgi:hypothetical protein